MLFADADPATNFVIALTGLITAIGTLIGVVIAGLKAYNNIRDAQKAASAKVVAAATEVKEALATQNTMVDQRLTTIHTLVNSSQGVLLKDKKDLLVEKAEKEPTPENLHAAELAKKAYESHQANQELVDQSSPPKA
jgi:hypothetical protein